MNRLCGPLSRAFSSFAFCAFLSANFLSAQNAPATAHHIGIEGDHFVLEGKPFQIISGELHYERIPREYWRDRLQKARAMGLNTVSTYVFWNVHEPRPGTYDFSGGRDVAAFIRTAQEEGLYVILRPGPYACAEWDLGGLPAWLLADPDIVLRSKDEKFLGPAERWLKRLGRELAPLQITQGGPILAVQVENEYGSFGDDHEYMKRILAAIRNAGLGEVLLYTADGGDELAAGTLPDVHAVVNFGPGEAKAEFAKLEKFRPGRPMMSGEYWDGWFDHWGEKHHGTDAAQQAQELDWILGQGYSINLYMFHGGTSFGFMNGANWEKRYEPDVTSYDYDSPVSESGALTQKYSAFRDVIAKHRPGVKFPEPPAPLPVIDIPEFELTESAPLWSNLPNPVSAKTPLPMERLGESYGYILYRTRLDRPTSGELQIRELRSYARIYVNGKLAGTLDRRLKQDRLRIEAGAGSTLNILVEGTGRINFTTELRSERQGIGGSVTLSGQELTGWEVYPLPMEDLSKLTFGTTNVDGPAFYRGEFTLSDTGDTFLDTRGWGKGAVWINGHALGRFWNLGPQQTLYVPAPWLHKGRNEIVAFTQDRPKDRRMRSLRGPVLDEMGSE
ncbi:MAG TPA: beta-galactosidase [Candidatus Sulfotelmatobacter sp.]|jgi:beta-galactosidase|nr:beta-galactosidase [Candidatus Sulfotelmatobacter sp.]